jgi:hypothetical protein
MAYPPRLFRCNISANLQGGEIMVHTVWMRTDTIEFGSIPNVQAVADRVRDHWSTTIIGGTGLPTGLASSLYTGTVYTKVSAYKVDAAGRSTAQAESQFAATVKGTGTQALPPQIAVVGTLLTDRPGRSGRGRIYLGGFDKLVVDPTGRIAAGSRNQIAQALGGFYRRLRDTPYETDKIRPVVVSPTLTDAFKVTRIAVGDVADTQRNRRNALVEAKFIEPVDV